MPERQRRGPPSQQVPPIAVGHRTHERLATWTERACCCCSACVCMCVSSERRKKKKDGKSDNFWLAISFSSPSFDVDRPASKKLSSLFYSNRRCLEAAARSRGPWPARPLPRQRQRRGLLAGRATTARKTTGRALPTPFTRPRTSSLPRTPAALRQGGST